jgi:hypothetical protein
MSLIALAGAVLIGVGMTMSIASRTEEMASFGAIAGIGFGFIASILSFVLALIGMFRREKPGGPAFFGFMLSAVPAAIGIWIVVQMLAQAYGL